MLFPLPIPQVLDLHLLVLLCRFAFVTTIYTVLIYAFLILGVMCFGRLCTRLLLRVHNTHSVVQAGRWYTYCKLPWSSYARCSQWSCDVFAFS